MLKFVVLFAVVLFSGCATVADAGSLVDVEVIDRGTGRALETYRHQGRSYVAGTPGARYALRITNRSGARVLTVLSVDGVNAVTGETAATKQSGYVLGSSHSAEIRGWRKSLDDVAAFYFTALPDSYAARTDRPDNVGVIGVAVFREFAEPRAEWRIEQPRYKSYPPRPAAGVPEQKSDAAAVAGSLKQEAERIGTGHGERLDDPTRYTEFRRGSEAPEEVVTIHYDSRPNLIARGVIPRTPRHVPPQPFPGGFVPDPRG